MLMRAKVADQGKDNFSKWEHKKDTFQWYNPNFRPVLVVSPHFEAKPEQFIKIIITVHC